MQPGTFLEVKNLSVVGTQSKPLYNIPFSREQHFVPETGLEPVSMQRATPQRHHCATLV
jgi:hypothetical protein